MLVFTAIAFVVTIIFKADVEAQGGAYATGVLVLMSSAAIAVALSTWRRGQRRALVGLSLIALVFVYTTILNIFERPEGIQIASFFIVAIVVTSLVSRVWRSTELRAERIELDETAQRLIAETSWGTLRIIANQLDAGDAQEYYLKEQDVRADTHIPADDPVLFLEITVCDASDFEGVIKVHGAEVAGYKVLRAESSAVPNAIAALLLYMRDLTGKIPHVYFEWAEGNPVLFLLRFILFGDGEIATVTREVVRRAEPDPKRRPAVHVGG